MIMVKAGQEWVALIATHYKKTTWTITRVPEIDQMRLHSSFSTMEGVISVTETRNLVSMNFQ